MSDESLKSELTAERLWKEEISWTSELSEEENCTNVFRLLGERLTKISKIAERRKTSFFEAESGEVLSPQKKERRQVGKELYDTQVGSYKKLSGDLEEVLLMGHEGASPQLRNSVLSGVNNLIV